MLEEGLQPDRKFYYDLIGILCGVERVNYALELFERMRRSSLGGYGPIYDVLIPKLCRGGNFGKGRELWDEAMAMGVNLSCSEEVLDPSITKVFKPKRKEKEEVRLKDFTPVRRLKIRARVKKTSKRKVKSKTKGAKKKKISASTRN
uniref:Pentatricopeptide repeat-containing protein n=1 Tax=Rhizophora mucronata TaxID=61149 RepID=A0A2P2J2D5_RHIMU